MTRNKFKFVFAVFLFTFVGLIFWFLPQNYPSFNDSANNASVANQTEQKINFTLKIDFGDGFVRDFDAIAYNGETLFQTLKRKLSEEKIEFNYKSYGDLGELVTQIGLMKNGDGGKDWQYWVNGIMPQIGVSFYKIKNSDIIEWRFKKYEAGKF